MAATTEDYQENAPSKLNGWYILAAVVILLGLTAILPYYLGFDEIIPGANNFLANLEPEMENQNDSTTPDDLSTSTPNPSSNGCPSNMPMMDMIDEESNTIVIKFFKWAPSDKVCVPYWKYFQELLRIDENFWDWTHKMAGLTEATGNTEAALATTMSLSLEKYEGEIGFIEFPSWDVILTATELNPISPPEPPDTWDWTPPTLVDPPLLPTTIPPTPEPTATEIVIIHGNDTPMEEAQNSIEETCADSPNPTRCTSLANQYLLEGIGVDAAIEQALANASSSECEISITTRLAWDEFQKGEKGPMKQVWELTDVIWVWSNGNSGELSGVGTQMSNGQTSVCIETIVGAPTSIDGGEWYVNYNNIIHDGSLPFASNGALLGGLVSLSPINSTVNDHDLNGDSIPDTLMYGSKLSGHVWLFPFWTSTIYGQPPATQVPTQLPTDWTGGGVPSSIDVIITSTPGPVPNAGGVATLKAWVLNNHGLDSFTMYGYCYDDNISEVTFHGSTAPVVVNATDLITRCNSDTKIMISTENNEGWVKIHDLFYTLK